MIRRRQLMPLALKIYVWFFMLLPFLSWISSSYSYVHHQMSFNISSIKSLVLVTAFSTILLPAVRFLSNLFILLEKKWAILFALIVTTLNILSWCYSTINMFYLLTPEFNTEFNIIVIFSICWLALEIPYLIMLLKIKRDWEKVPDKELTDK